DPHPDLLQTIREDEREFLSWLELAEQTACTPAEQVEVAAIHHGYQRFQRDFEQVRARVEATGPQRNYRQLAESQPLRLVSDPSQEYLRTNEELMEGTAAQAGRFTGRLRLVLVLLGLGGPLGGLLCGYGIARGLSRSLSRLNIHIRDVNQQFERD